MFSINFMLVILILHQFPSFGYEYCAFERELCDREHHVACNERRRDSRQREPVVPFITSKLREKILQEHNYYRNKTANGDIFDRAEEQFPTASQMHELMWDFELEYLAKTRTSQCTEGETFCQNTFRFRNVGQNQGVIEMDNSGHEDMIPEIHMEEQLESWFEKHVIVYVSQIENFNITGYDYIDFIMYAQRTSFLLMVSDQVKQVGCGLSYCRVDNQWEIHTVCNYSKDLVLGEPVYKTGEPGSECKKRSKEYPSLCAGENKSIYDYEDKN